MPAAALTVGKAFTWRVHAYMDEKCAAQFESYATPVPKGAGLEVLGAAVDCLLYRCVGKPREETVRQAARSGPSSESDFPSVWKGKWEWRKPFPFCA